MRAGAGTSIYIGRKTPIRTVSEDLKERRGPETPIQDLDHFSGQEPRMGYAARAAQL